MFTVDAHLDLSMNAMEWNRDLRKDILEINEREKHLTDKPDRGNATVSFNELRKGEVGLVVATQIARYIEPTNPLPGWHSPEQAWAQTQAQIAWYKTMENEGEMYQVTDLKSLELHLKTWNENLIQKKPIGYILSLEGADSLINLHYLTKAYGYGLRAIGPAHYGPGRFAYGTDSEGGLTKMGKELLKEMDKLNMFLDATHLCEQSFWEALKLFKGPIWASHNNVRKIVNHNRQFTDEQIKELITRKAVIGGALDAWMLVPEWQKGISSPLEMNCSLEKLIDHYDHICQIAGNSLHIGIGSDLDGAFGREQCPFDVQTIADVNKLPSLLRKRGYSEQDIFNVMHGNWLRFLKENWD